MLRLRTSDGLDTDLIKQHYGLKAYDALLIKAKSFIDQGLLRKDRGSLILTNDGVMLSDNIISNLMWD
jgi:oxygen-independent coproporphyrinogen-3 oxidase